jgi:hypothetical protein
VNSLMSQDKNDEDVKDYIYLDPKNTSKKMMNNFDYFESSIVFMLGSSNYDEYQNLKNFNKNIIFGSTEIIRSDDFLFQIFN